MSIDLDTLFTHRDDWQRGTFEAIKQSLICARNNRFIRYDSGREEHLVIVYGNSQVGKTTLLLTMIGIREGECFQEVAETLRAGIPRGNSSTSTAIIYARSEDDRYGLALTTMDNCPPREVSFYEKQDMIRRLAQVRETVEANQADENSILYIAIPRRCFADEAAREHIVILDMPGVKSRNRRESAHVQSLMNRYFPIASACVIACCSNEIQSLETLELPDKLDWKRMEHRFVLAITRAYSAGNVKAYFNQPRKDREADFYGYIMETYTREIRAILGKNNHTEFFPVDLGDSLERLTQELAGEDREELLNTRNTVLSNLRGWIAGHQENRLKAALDNLRDVVEHAGAAAIGKADQEAENVRKDIEKARRSIRQAENYIRLLVGGSPEEGGADGEIGSTGRRDELLEEIKALEAAREKLRNFHGVKGLYEDLEKELQSQNLEKDGDGVYWKDKGKAVYAALRVKAAEKAAQGVQALKPEADVSRAVQAVELDQQCVTLWSQNAPAPQGLFSFKKNRVYIDKLKTVCLDMECVINKALRRAAKPSIQQLDRELVAKKRDVENVEQQVRDSEARIRRLNKKIEGELNRKLQACEEERERLRQRQKQDQRTLDMYKKYARRAHDEQRRQLITQINSRLPSKDKLVLILFLGVLDRDYQKVTGGAYESTD